MASPAKAFCASDLVDLSDGHISREIFVNDEIYAREQEQIFARVWLFVGHESQAAKPGDYFVSCMGEESVILCRDRAGQLHVFLNSCRHRGMKVCRYDEGNTPVFTCPYHGWSYAADGSLVGVPYFEDAYHEQLDKSKWGLVEVAQLENYKGDNLGDLGQERSAVRGIPWRDESLPGPAVGFPETAMKAGRKSSAASKNGPCLVTGSFRRKTLPEMRITTSVTVQWTLQASVQAGEAAGTLTSRMPPRG